MSVVVHRPERAPLLFFAAAGLLLCFAVVGRLLSLSAAGLLRVDAGLPGKGSAPETAVSPAVLAYLENDFCAPELCPTGSWSEWIILTADDAWTVEELQTIRRTILTTRAALDEAGLDGGRLLGGYRFRNTPRIYLDACQGVLGRVLHTRQEIELGDGAISKQWGFFLYHELAHVADRRLDQSLTREFQRATAGEAAAGSKRTADGFWLDEFARDQPEEAMADAFALWVMLNHTADPQPVFWRKPDHADYQEIARVMDTILHRVAARR